MGDSQNQLKAVGVAVNQDLSINRLVCLYEREGNCPFTTNAIVSKKGRLEVGPAALGLILTSAKLAKSSKFFPEENDVAIFRGEDGTPVSTLAQGINSATWVKKLSAKTLFTEVRRMRKSRLIRGRGRSNKLFHVEVLLNAFSIQIGFSEDLLDSHLIEDSELFSTNLSYERCEASVQATVAMIQCQPKRGGKGGMTWEGYVWKQLIPGADGSALVGEKGENVAGSIISIDLPREQKSALPALPQRDHEILCRETELEELVDLVSKKKLVVVQAPPCMGKSRLVLEVAHLLSGSGDLCSAYIDVTECETLPSLRERIGSHFEEAAPMFLAKNETGEVRVARLLKSLCPLVLVLDNFEQLDRPSALFVERLSSECSGLHVLVGSRESLSVGEQLYPLGPLSERDDSHVALADLPPVRFFRYFADFFTGQTFDSPRNLKLIRELCRRAGGFPAPMKVAAQLLNDLSLVDLHTFSESWMDDEEYAQPREVLFRQLNFIFESLDSIDQERLLSLAYFRGKFDSDLARKLLFQGDEKPIRKTLIKLSRKQLLRGPYQGSLTNQGTPRYGFYLPIREWAIQRSKKDFPSEKIDNLRSRVVDVVAKRVDDFTKIYRRTEDPEILTSFIVDLPLIFRVHRDCLKRGDIEISARILTLGRELFRVAGQADGLLETIEQTLEIGRENLKIDSIVELEFMKSQVLWRLGNFQKAYQVTRKIEKRKCFTENCSRMEVKAWSLRTKCDAKFLDTRHSFKLSRAMVNVGRAEENDEAIVWSSIVLADCFEVEGRANEALAELRISLRSVRRKSSKAFLLNKVGLITWRDNQLSEAKRVMSEALALNEEINNRIWIGGARTNLGFIYTDLEAFEAAREQLDLADEVHRREGNMGWLSVSHVARGRLLLREGKYSEARDFLNLKKVEIKSTGYEENIFLMEAVIAIASARLGETDLAIVKLEAVEKHLGGAAPAIVRRFAVLVELLILQSSKGNKKKVKELLISIDEIVDRRGMNGKSEAKYVNRLYRKYLSISRK